MPDMERDLVKVKEHLQVLVTKKIGIMNSKSFIGRFVE